MGALTTAISAREGDLGQLWHSCDNNRTRSVSNHNANANHPSRQLDGDYVPIQAGNPCKTVWVMFLLDYYEYKIT